MTYAELRALQKTTPLANIDPAVFARVTGAATGNASYGHLADPSLLSQLEYQINRGVNATGAPQVFGSVGGALFGETGREVFESVPRSAANFLPLALGAIPGVGWGATALAGAGALSGLQAWGETEQVVPTVVGAALGAATPAIGRLGANAALKGMGVGLSDEAAGAAVNALRATNRIGVDEVANTTNLLRSVAPRTVPQAIGASVGANAAVTAAGVLGDATSIASDDNRSFNELLAPEYWAAQGLAQLPFVGLEAMTARAALAQGRGVQRAINDIQGRPERQPTSFEGMEYLGEVGGRVPTQEEINAGFAEFNPPPILPVKETVQSGPPQPVVDRSLMDVFREAQRTNRTAAAQPPVRSRLYVASAAERNQATMTVLDPEVAMLGDGRVEALVADGLPPVRAVEESAEVLNEVARIRESENTSVEYPFFDEERQQNINESVYARMEEAKTNESIGEEVSFILKAAKRAEERGAKTDVLQSYARWIEGSEGHPPFEGGLSGLRRFVNASVFKGLKDPIATKDRSYWEGEKGWGRDSKAGTLMSMEEARLLKARMKEEDPNFYYEISKRAEGKAKVVRQPIIRRAPEGVEEVVTHRLTDEDVKMVLGYDDNMHFTAMEKVASKLTERGQERFAHLLALEQPPSVMVEPATWRKGIDTIISSLREDVEPSVIIDRLQKALGDDFLTFTSPEIVNAIRHARMAAETPLSVAVRALDGAVDEGGQLQARALLDHAQLMRAEKAESGAVGKLYNMLRLSGASDAVVAQELPTLARLFGIHRGFGDVDFATLSTPEGMQNAGLFASNEQGRRVVAVGAREGEMVPWIVSHELVGHGVWDMWQRGELSVEDTLKLNKYRANVERMSVDERGALLREAATMLPERLRNNAEVQRLLSDPTNHANTEEVLANMNAITALSLVGGRKSYVQDFIRYMPKPIADFLTTVADYARRFVDTLRALTPHGEMRKVFNQNRDIIRSIMKEARNQEHMASALAASRAIVDEGGWTDTLSSVPRARDHFEFTLGEDGMAPLGSAALSFLGGKEMAKSLGAAVGGVGKGLGETISYFLKPITQVGEGDKRFRAAAQAMMRRDESNARLLKDYDHLLGGDMVNGVVKFPKDSPIFKVMEDADTLRALNDVRLFINKEGEMKTLAQLEGERNVGVQAIMSRVSPERQQAIREASGRLEKAQEAMLPKLQSLDEDLAAAQVARTSLFTPSGTSDLRYDAVLEVLKRQKGQPPEATAQALMAAGMGEEAALRAATSYGELVDLVGQQYAARATMPGYITERRMSPWQITFTDANGERGLIDATNESQARQIAAVYERQGKKDIVVREPKKVETPRGTDALEEVAAQSRDRAIRRFREMGYGEEDAMNMADVVDFQHDVQRDLLAREIGTLAVTRRFAAGREDLNMIEQQFRQMHAMVRQKTKRITEAELGGWDRDAVVGGTPEMRTILTGWKNYKEGDSDLQRGISKAGYMMTLAGNAVNYAQEMAQPMVQFPWKLVDEGVGVTEANRQVAKASKDIGKTWLSKKFWKEGKYDFSFLPKEEQELLRLADKEGGLASGVFSEMSEADIQTTFEKARERMGLTQFTPLTKAHAGMQALFRGASRVHNKFTAFSSGVAHLAAYRSFRGQGMEHVVAMRKARELATVGMFTAGRAGRPAGIHDVGAAKPLATMMMSLQSFTLNSIFTLGNYYKRATDGSLPNAERAAAAKALAGSSLAQIALAGVIGLPFVGPAMRMVEKMTGWDMEEELVKLGQDADDPEAGSILKQMLLRGVSHGIGGPDLGSRYTLGNVLGLNEQSGFTFDNLFGPVGSFGINSIGALQELGKGDFGRALEGVAPVAIKKALRMWNDDGEFRSRDGDLLLADPTDAERAMYVVGFQPTRLAKSRIAYNITKRAREGEEQKLSGWARDIADLVTQGGVDEARMALLEKAEEEGIEDINGLVTRVANAAERKMFPSRPEGTGSARSSVGDTQVVSGLGVESPMDEVARVEMRNEIARVLGGRPVGEKRYDLAKEIDALRKQNPFLTVSRAAAIARQRQGLRGRSLGSL